MPGAYFNLGNVFFVWGKFDSAMVNYQKAMKFDKNLLWAYGNMAIVYEKKGAFDKAIQQNEALM